ncbi:hypothetical protein Gorai_021012, partial [Gossypium raimondii]|nr:hypothetical protein [Gossypium raimondii]
EDLTLVVESEEALGEEYQLRFLFDWGRTLSLSSSIMRISWYKCHE